MSKYKQGQKGEELAAVWLEQQGMTIVERNYHCRQGEVDLIGRDGSYLVFVEVKARESKRCGYPGEALTMTKRKRICQTARFYCYEKKLSLDQPIRFDVVEILGNQIRHTKNAFDFIL